MFNLENIHSFLKGVNLFYDRFSRRDSVSKIVWQEGSTRVRDYSAIFNSNLPNLFFIPSLINKSYILDLDEETSITRHFAALGYRVFLIDFAEPIDEELAMGFADYQKRIVKAIEATCKDEPIITIGYCLGGIFSYTIRHQLNLVGQIFIATPWEFSHLQQLLNLNNPLILSSLIGMVKNLNKMPPSLIQLFFSYLTPNRIWDKFCQFSDMQNPQEIDKFLLLEQWVNDGISLTKPLALEGIDMIANNSLNKFILDDSPSSKPCLMINGREDKIVPINSSLPLYDLLSHKEILIEQTGHVGLIVSKLAQQKIWPKIENWLEQFTYNL